MAKPIRNQFAYDRAQRRQERRLDKAADRIARRIPGVISTMHGHRLAVYDRNQALVLLSKGGSAGSSRFDQEAMSLGLERAIDAGSVTFAKDAETGELTFETEQPQPAPISDYERIVDRYEAGELLLQPHLYARVVKWGEQAAYN